MKRMILVASLSLVSSLPCLADPPRFVTEKEFSCKDTADAVNYYVGMGEVKAIKEMLGTVADADARSSMRICHLCRILFEPRWRKPLRDAALGELDLPTNTMPSSRWPRFPIAESGSTFFLLNESYHLGGKAERLTDYIEYCHDNGVFRKNRVAVPSRKQALEDLGRLRRSDVWTAIRWQDRGENWSYALSEERTLRYMKAQAERTPAR
jgi:hypothetical protein